MPGNASGGSAKVWLGGAGGGGESFESGPGSDAAAKVIDVPGSKLIEIVRSPRATATPGVFSAITTSSIVLPETSTSLWLPVTWLPPDSTSRRMVILCDV